VADIAAITSRYEALKPILDERTRRLVAAAESLCDWQRRDFLRFQSDRHLGSCNSARNRRIERSRIACARPHPPARWRAEEGSRQRWVAPLRWTCKGVRQLTAELTHMKHRVSHQVVADLLHGLGYSLQANHKAKEGTNHPDCVFRRCE
jgi:hypothetical protein